MILKRAECMKEDVGHERKMLQHYNIFIFIIFKKTCGHYASAKFGVNAKKIKLVERVRIPCATTYIAFMFKLLRKARTQINLHPAYFKMLSTRKVNS